jgi:hypothetical protein
VVVEEVELEELVLAATVVVVEAGAVDTVEAVEVLVLLVVVVVLEVVVSLEEVLELRSMTPLLLVSAAWATEADAPESDPPDPQADSTTQQVSASTPCPEKRCIERLGERLKWPHSHRGTTAATMS